MLKKGIYVIGFSYPVVPMGEAHIRFLFFVIYYFIFDKV